MGKFEGLIPADRRVRIVQAGCGGMGRPWIRNLMNQPEVELVGLVDIAAGAAAKARDEVGGEALRAVACGTDIAQMLADLRPDAVVDVTVPSAHRPVTLAALAAGCHVLGEKPLAESMVSAREMVTAAAAARRLYMVSQSRRYCTMVTAAREALASGLIGDVHTINADFYLGAHFGGFRAEMDSPLLLDMAIHHFDMARCMTGADPRHVYAVEYNPPGSWYRGAVSAQCMFAMAIGARPVWFNYRGSWCSEGWTTSWQAAWRIVGSRGTLLWDGDHMPQVNVVDENRSFINAGHTWTLPQPRRVLPGIAGSLDEFIHALRHGITPQAEGADNIKSLAMVFSAVDSARQGRRLPVEAC